MARRPNARTRVFHRQPRARDRIWQAMRILRSFTVADLVATAEAGRENARRYVVGLRNAGYVVMARPKRNGHRGGHALYRLVRDTGPHAPRLQSDGRTYDPNEHQVYEGGFPQ